MIKGTDRLLWKLKNVLRGDMMLVKQDITLTSEEKLEEMKAIKEMTQYLEDYYKQKEMKERLEDDGR